jgi:hypothetical protein
LIKALQELQFQVSIIDSVTINPAIFVIFCGGKFKDHFLSKLIVTNFAFLWAIAVDTYTESISVKNKKDILFIILSDLVPFWCHFVL